MRKAFFDAIKDKINTTDPSAHYYQVIGSGLDEDVLMAGRAAITNVVKKDFSVLLKASIRELSVNRREPWRLSLKT